MENGLSQCLWLMLRVLIQVHDYDSWFVIQVYLHGTFQSNVPGPFGGGMSHSHDSLSLLMFIVNGHWLIQFS